MAEQTKLPFCAEYLIEQPGAIERAKVMMNMPNVSIGLHFELSGISDAERVQMTKDLKRKGTCLGEQKEMQQKAAEDARRQLRFFRDQLGRNPAHISTHGNFNADINDKILPWWMEMMNELFEGDIPPMQLKAPHVRHNFYSWNCEGTKRSPCEPEEFGERLSAFKDFPLTEFVLHPALPKAGDAGLDMLFTAEMRRADTEAALKIFKSGTIERVGFRAVSVISI